MSWIDLLGWIAAGFTLLAHGMRTMLPLRIAGIGANLFFIAYSVSAGIVPTLALHVVLLPFNLYRLWEILRTRRDLKAVSADWSALEVLGPYLSVTRYGAGQPVFAKGDPPDHLYLLKSGRVLLEEINVELGPDEIFGEIAFFTDAREWTVSARCIGPCEIARINEETFLKLYYQNPAFGLYVMKLATRRLMEGMAKRPLAYQPVKGS